MQFRITLIITDIKLSSNNDNTNTSGYIPFEAHVCRMNQTKVGKLFTFFARNVI